jgi:hypothetical protein
MLDRCYRSHTSIAAGATTVVCCSHWCATPIPFFKAPLLIESICASLNSVAGQWSGLRLSLYVYVPRFAQSEVPLRIRCILTLADLSPHSLLCVADSGTENLPYNANLSLRHPVLHYSFIAALEEYLCFYMVTSCTFGSKNGKLVLKFNLIL